MPDAELLEIPLLVGGRRAGQLVFALTGPEDGSGRIARLELDDAQLRGELEGLFQPGNFFRVRVRSIIDYDLGTSLDGVFAALYTLFERHPSGPRAFTYEGGEHRHKGQAFWNQPGIVV